MSEITKFANSIISQTADIRRRADSITDPDTLNEILAALRKADNELDDLLTDLMALALAETLTQG
jgi:hypothetical protein